MKWWYPGVLVFAVLGCAPSASAPAPDGQLPDAAARPDGSARHPDAAPAPADAAAPDAGPAQLDPDAAMPPRTDLAAVPCADSLSDVYVTPSGLPDMTAALRGTPVRCAYDSDLDAGAVSQRLASARQPAVVVATGVQLVRVAFRTLRGDGSPAVSTALVYLPHTPASLPLPLIVVGHPTSGIADSCAPSIEQSSLDNLALPWAAHGYPVIAPDQAGLGNPGVPSYLDNRESGQTLLDGARALRQLLPAVALSRRILLVGYSQGGGSVLSAQALAGSYGADGDLVGVIGFAPEWQTRLNSFGYVDLLRHPSDLTISTGISKPVIAAMRAYTWFAAAHGEASAGDAFPAAQRAGLDSAIQSMCFLPFGGYLQAATPHLGDFIDDDLRQSLLGCIDGGACAEPGQSYFQFLSNNILHGDPAGAPILYVQGLADQILLPAEEAACNVAALRADGVKLQVCTDLTATHSSLLDGNVGLGLAWGEAILAGSPPATCSELLPPCQP